MALVCALCLPLSQCSQGGNSSPPPSRQTLLSQLLPQSNNKVTVRYPVAIILACFGIAFSKSAAYPGAPTYPWYKGLCLLVALTWPLISVLAASRLTGRRFSWLYDLLELLLCVGTGYMVFAITMWDDWLYGAYVIVVSLGLFACSVLAVLAYSTWRGCRRWWDKFTRPSDNSQAIAGPAPGA
jgi:hypothetical protein